MKKNRVETYVPIDMFVRIVRVDGENSERAMLVARRKDDPSREYVFTYYDPTLLPCDLIVNDFVNESHV